MNALRGRDAQHQTRLPASTLKAGAGGPLGICCVEEIHIGYSNDEYLSRWRSLLSPIQPTDGVWQLSSGPHLRLVHADRVEMLASFEGWIGRSGGGPIDGHEYARGKGREHGGHCRERCLWIENLPQGIVRRPVVTWGQNLQRTSNSTMASPWGSARTRPPSSYDGADGQRREPPSSGRTAKPAIKPMHWAAYRVSDKSVAIVVAVF